MTEYRLLLQRIGLIGITQLLIGLSSVILLPILTKNLSIEDYGVWAQITASIGVFPGLVMLGLPYTIIRFLPALKKKEDIQEIFYSILFLLIFTSGTASLLLYIYCNTIASMLFDNKVFVVKILSAVVFVECLNYFLISYLRARQQIQKYSFSNLLKTMLDTSIVSFFVLIGKGISTAITGLLLSDILVFLVIFYLIVSEIGIKRPRFKNIKKYLNFGIPTVPSNFSNWIVNSSDRYIIGILLGTASVGYYSPGYTLGNAINMLFAPLSILLPATLSKSYDENNLKEVNVFLSYSFKYLMIMAIPITFGISFLSKPILAILATQEIASQGYLITPFTALSSLLFGAYGIIAEILFLEKRTLISGKIWIIAATLNFILNFIFIPYFGIIGAAITTLIAFGVSLVLTIYYSFNSLKFDVDLKFIAKSVVSSILMSYIIYLLKPEGLISILLTVGICASVYFIALFLLKGFNKKELKLLYKEFR